MMQYTDQAIALLSTVAIRQELSDRNLGKGTIGTVVELLVMRCMKLSFAMRTVKRSTNAH